MDHSALVQATREQEIVSKKRHSEVWGNGLSEEQYLAREERFKQREHARDGKMTVWVLVPKDDIKTLDFFCSCETLRRTALCVRPWSNEPEEVIGYGIASVFCPPHHRRKGYTSHMMRLLHHILAPPSTYDISNLGIQLTKPPRGVGGDALFSALYSDVGEFYKSCAPLPNENGWIIRGAVSTVWPATIPADPTDPPSTFLTLDECQHIWTMDAQYILDTLKHRTVGSTTCISFQPDAGVAAFVAMRAASFFKPPAQPPEHWGVKLTIPEEEPPTYATWALDERVLIVTRLRATPRTLPALVRELARAARAIGMTVVEVWELPLQLRDVAASLGGITNERKNNLPAIAWYGPEDLDTVDWWFNEKFAWC